MGRELKRVALDFNWPLEKVWEGYIGPRSRRCPDCEHGYTKAREWLESLTHLLLIAGGDSVRGKLHPWLSSLESRSTNEPPSKDMVELTTGLAGRPPGFGNMHDALDRYSAEEKIIQAAGLDPKKWGICQTCQGEGVHPEDVNIGKDWQRTEPPTGEGYQVWETVSEGSPVSPVFPTTEACIAWLVSRGYSKTAAENFIKMGWVPSMIMTGGKLHKDIEAAGVLGTP